MSTVDDQRVWLERIMTSTIIGFVVRDENGTLMQCVENDPELRLALIEWQTQRIREMERSQRWDQRAAATPVTYPTPEEAFTPDGSGGQAGDDYALGQALSELAWQTNNAGRDYSVASTPPSFPGS